MNKDLQIRYISTDDQLADVLIKALSLPQFLCLHSKLMPHFLGPEFAGDEKQWSKTLSTSVILSFTC